MRPLGPGLRVWMEHLMLRFDETIPASGHPGLSYLAPAGVLEKVMPVSCFPEEPKLAEPIAPGISGGGDGEPDPAAVRRARAGDPVAFQAIFQRYARPVMAFIYNLVGDRPRAEELTQETFLRAYRGLERMQESTRLSTWLFGIARNVAREAMRDRRRNLRLVVLDEGASNALHDARSGPDDRFLADELHRAIRRSLDDLSEDQRTVFVLKMLHNMRYHEISVITGSSIGKLKTDLHRARQQLRMTLQPYISGPDPDSGGGL